MAKVRLTRYECEEDLLPPVCMVCGEPSTCFRERTFSWYPGWVNLLAILALLPALIVSLILTRRMTVQVPLCAEHRSHWTWRTLLSYLGVLFLVGFVVVMVITVSMPERDCPLWAKWTVFGCGLTILIVIVAFVKTAIAPVEITDRQITLSDVAQGFIEALEKERRRDDDEEEEFRRWKRERRRGQQQRRYEEENDLPHAHDEFDDDDRFQERRR